MSDGRHTLDLEPSAARLLASPAQAKVRLLDWAEEHDARHERYGTGTLALRGALAVVGGMVIGRVLSGRKRAVVPATRARTANARWLAGALAARVGQWLLPYAISAVRQHWNGQSRRDPPGSPAEGASGTARLPGRSPL